MKKSRIKRYTSKPKIYPHILLTGKVLLKYEDDETDAARGDVLLFLNTENSHRVPNKGDYYSTGYAGYVRMDVFDGKFFKPVSLPEFFTDGENYFTKAERSFDTCMLCKELLAGFAGRNLKRTYREHYLLLDEEGDEEE